MILKQAQVGELQQYQIGQYVIPYRDIVHPDGLVRVEYYHEDDVEQPQAFTKFRSRMSMFQNEYASWKSVGFDSATLMELCARMYEKKILNPETKDARQWWAGGTDSCEEMLVVRSAGLPMNVGLLCHVDKAEAMIANESVRNASLPGRLSSRGQINAAFQEQYYIYTRKLENGDRVFEMKTQNDGRHQATSQIDAPNPCYPHYSSIWSRWQGAEKPNVHIMIYGDTGTGKSTFLATFPKPLLVWCFDPHGKDFPYWKWMDFSG